MYFLIETGAEYLILKVKLINEEFDENMKNKDSAAFQDMAEMITTQVRSKDSQMTQVTKHVLHYENNTASKTRMDPFSFEILKADFSFELKQVYKNKNSVFGRTIYPFTTATIRH